MKIKTIATRGNSELIYIKNDLYILKANIGDIPSNEVSKHLKTLNNLIKEAYKNGDDFYLPVRKVPYDYDIKVVNDVTVFYVNVDGIQQDHISTYLKNFKDSTEEAETITLLD